MTPAEGWQNARMSKKLPLILFTFLLCAAAAVPASEPTDQKTRDIMHDVAEALSVLLPLSLDSDTFLSAGNRDTVMDNLSKLESSADALADHGIAESLDFRLLAAAFARGAARVREDFEYLHPAEARYFLVDLTQHCVACHSRETAGRDFPLSGALNEYLREQPLNEQERARLQVALRQFDDAMTTWEGIISDASREPVDIALDGNLVEYLTVAVRVGNAHERAAKHLEQLSAREATPFYLRRRLQTWIEDLEAAEARGSKVPDMAVARDMFRRAETRPGLLWNDAHLVSDLALSAALQRLVASKDDDIPPAQLAETYYMLGVLEARTIGLYSALPSMERYWEAAVRTAPDSPHALEAYALLEEYAATTFTGELPFERTSDMFARLAELRSLIGIQ